MSDNQTIGEILSKHKKNFENFLDRIASQTDPDLVADTRKLTDEEFIAFIKRSVIPYKNCLELVLTVIFMQINLKREDVSDEDVAKFKNFLELFCEIAEQIVDSPTEKSDNN